MGIPPQIKRKMQLKMRVNPKLINTLLSSPGNGPDYVNEDKYTSARVAPSLD